jgi:hypothetical protein
MKAPINQTPKLNESTTGSERCLLKQRNATRKKRILGKIPHNAPFV